MLEFETSDSFEFMRSADFRRDVALVDTFYDGAADKIYVYSRRYIVSVLEANDLEVREIRRFHHFSTLAYRLTRNERLSARWSALDALAARIPVVKDLSANIFITAQKRAQRS